MNKTIQSYTISNIFFDVILKSFSDLSIDIYGIFDKKDMYSRNENINLNIEEFNYYCNKIINQTDLKNFNLKISYKVAQYSMNGLVYSIMLNSATIEQAMENLCKYHKLVSNIIAPEIKRENDRVIFSFNPSGLSDKFMWHYSESFVCLILLNIRSLLLLKEEIFPDAIYLQIKTPRQIMEYTKLFGSNIHFDSKVTKIIFDKDLLKKPILFANKELLNILTKHAEEKIDKLFQRITWSERVTNLLNESFYGKKSNIKLVAKELMVSDRNLQIKLKNEGTTYKKLLESVRKEITLNFLKKRDANFYDITFLLGYSEQSVFNHAFKKWTGMTPGEYRKNNSIESDLQ